MGFFGKLSGKDIEDNLKEYGEIYGEVLLGMHRDIQSHQRLIQDSHQGMTAMLDEARAILSEMKRYYPMIKIVFWIAIIAIVLSLFSIGVVIWTTI